ncbi:Uncharacterized membrane-anchored protein YitT, contains DUF161 and DUF2179 domains [Clostridium acidisoli DSM 12555]|uniref:Uncharacterized membrane-anchored protein YitT, contains DUF161 and DUF2179 domains n=1 Tax=Clostridium acidisoli DSM 12555 TaxID=1121291 RepID=A0A1W1XJW2_9CLOT|nr:YitT family protein [Clostridium acidisoli]SMC23831.1 Uncharacterized membrane-anchored protein YitT, contains DUF161 and DUF2179 domains [Clostridium acidisoli DSM 12555]
MIRSLPKVHSQIVENLEILLGSFLTALGFNVFLNPNDIASGGVAGISVIIKHVFGVQPAITQFALNIPLFFLGLIILGKLYGLRTVVGSFFLPFFIFLTKNIPAITLNPLLASIYGGLVVGIGLGLVFKGNASTGGLSIIASIVNKYTGFSMGKCQMLTDACVVISASIVFSPDKVLYALISIFLTSKAIDLIQLGFTSSKVAFVVSDKSDEISKIILKNLNRGLTKLSGLGGYTEESRTVLMVVMEQSEITRFKNMVEAIDPSAFIIISNTHEVLGRGFNLHKES